MAVVNFHDLTRSLPGLPVTRAWQGYGSAIFLEFGAMRSLPKLRGKRRGERGEFSLMLEWSWRVEGSRTIKFGSWSNDDRIEKGLADLEGRTVKDVWTEGSLPEIAVNLGAVVVRSFMVADGQPAWTLFLPSGKWLRVKRGAIVIEAPRG